MTSGPDLSTPAAQRAWSKLIQQEEAEISAEIEAAQHAAEMGRAERDRQMRAAALAAVERLKSLQPLYAERDAAAKRALSVLAEFVEIERSLSADERRILSSVPAAGLDGGQVQQSLLAMRAAAGLPMEHDRLEVVATDEAQRVALSAIAGILIGLIGDGFIAVGGNAAQLNIRR